VKLFCIHINLKLELGSQVFVHYFKHQHDLVTLKVPFVFPLHLFLLLIRGKFVFFITLFVVCPPLFYYLLYLLFAFRWVLNCFFSHYFHVVFQCDSRQRCGHQSKANFLLLLLFLFNSFFPTQLPFFLFCQVKRHCHLLYRLNLFIL
jgi:hypothetical protein